MALHVFGAVLTAHGTAANNRGSTEGNVTTLQKVVWNGQVHTTVSAEAIRFALRRWLAAAGHPCNREYDEATRSNKWEDHEFKRWARNAKEEVFIDDDLLGYMAAAAAKEEGTKGSAKVRRAVLEVTRAVSLVPWAGDVTFNAASPNATPSAQKQGTNPVPYGTEMHATRYQYGFALTPAALRAQPARRARAALEALCSLGEVAGNHGRFLFDFSAESVVLRLTDEAAPRILYAFEVSEHGAVGLPGLLFKVRSGDIRPNELVLGGPVTAALDGQARATLAGATVLDGVRAGVEEGCRRIEARLSAKEASA